LAPEVHELWLLWRPVIAEVATYEAMFVHQYFSFADIHRLHEMLDLKAYDDAVGQAEADTKGNKGT
jgi:hypothetical protein